MQSRIEYLYHMKRELRDVFQQTYNLKKINPEILLVQKASNHCIYDLFSFQVQDFQTLTQSRIDLQSGFCFSSCPKKEKKKKKKKKTTRIRSDWSWSLYVVPFQPSKLKALNFLRSAAFHSLKSFSTLFKSGKYFKQELITDYPSFLYLYKSREPINEKKKKIFEQQG